MTPQPGGSGASSRVTRRTVLRGVGAAAVCGAGLTAATPGAAQSGADVEVVDLREDASHSLPSEDELLVFAHGWLATDGAAGQTADLADALAATDYEADANVAIQWDADDLNYASAESHTETVGAELAGLVETYADETDGTVRLVGHSLGGRVVLETLRHLGEGYEIATVAPMGTAANGSTVVEGGRWYDGVAQNAASVRNYHSENDATVGTAYGGGSDTALGTAGASDSSATAATYVDVDVTEHVASHTDYTANEAVASDLAEAILAAEDGDTGEDDPDDEPSACEAADAAGIEELSDGRVVCDLDGDGEYRDVTGDGSVTNADVTEFFANQHVDPMDSRPDRFDFDGDDRVSTADVIQLFESL